MTLKIKENKRNNMLFFCLLLPLIRSFAPTSPARGEVLILFFKLLNIFISTSYHFEITTKKLSARQLEVGNHNSRYSVAY